MRYRCAADTSTPSSPPAAASSAPRAKPTTSSSNSRARAARGSVRKRGLGTGDGAKAGALGADAICSRPPWNSWTKSRVPCGWTAAATRRYPSAMSGRYPPSVCDVSRPETWIADASSTINPTPPRARASWYATKSSVGRWSWTCVVWCAVETIRFESSTGPIESGLESLENTLERLALRLRQRSRAPELAVTGDQDRLGLGGQLAFARPDLLAERDTRVADAPERAAHDDLLVLEPQLAPEVDRDAREHEVPRVAELPESGVDPLVAALLEIRRVDGVVDVHVRIDVAPADLDALLVTHRPRS